jgi:hypothetical protein
MITNDDLQFIILNAFEFKIAPHMQKSIVKKKKMAGR